MPDTPASPASSNASPARDGRLQALKTWLAGLPATYGLDIASLAPASSDASFRRYFRLTATSPQGNLIVMDAPPPQEDCRPFVHADQIFGAAGLTVPGVLDFQDAVYGPMTYDLVSILRDAYIRWDEEQVLDWCIRHWERARAARLPVPADFSDFYRDFEWMGIQRHLKVLGIFARLNYRDGKAAYLNDMPLVAHYVHVALRRYDELAPLCRLFEKIEGISADHRYTF